MKRKRSPSSSSNSSSSGDQSNAKESSEQPSKHQPKKKKTTGENQHNTSKSQSSVSVRLQNADMLAKYRNKNSHIIIENPKDKSNYLGNDISDDDEIWLCEIPNSIDVNQLLGKSVKLGSRKSFIKVADNTQLKCVSTEYDRRNDVTVYANTVSVVFQDDDAKLSLKNLQPKGQMIIHKHIEDDQRETVELGRTGRHECTVFPESLRVRHPLFGNCFEDKIQLNQRIAEKLSAAQAIDNNSYGDGIRIKKEKEDSSGSSSSSGSSKKQSKEPKSTDKPISIKTEKNTTQRNGLDDDAARIRQIFQQC